MEKLNSHQNNDIFLVIGATSPSGKHVVKALLDKKKIVRVLINNQQELEKIFTNEERLKIEKIIICDIEKGIIKNHTDTITECLESKGDSRVSYLITSQTLSNNGDLYATLPQKMFSFNKQLIDKCVAYGYLKKFVFLSPKVAHFSYFSLNYYKTVRHVQYYNAQIEEYLKIAGLFYLIVRPIGLTIADTPSSFSINQGEIMHGNINTATVGRVLVDTMLDAWIPSNVTYECVSYQDQFNSPYLYAQGLYRLKQDKHKVPCLRTSKRKFYSRFVMMAVFSGVLFFCYSTGRIHLYLPEYMQKVFDYFLFTK